jgi:hypothetical protein
MRMSSNWTVDPADKEGVITGILLLRGKKGQVCKTT